MKNLLPVDAAIARVNQHMAACGMVNHDNPLPEARPDSPYHIYTIPDLDGWQTAKVWQAPNGARFAVLKPKYVRRHMGGPVAATGYAIQRKPGVGAYKIADYGRACRYFAALALEVRTWN